MKISDPTGRLARWSIYLQAYDFEIIHRAGRKHSNVDALSRPVMFIQKAQATKEDDDSNEKSLDPYDDESLMHYLKIKRHQPGSSKKRIKKVIKLSEKYKFEDNHLQCVINR